MTTVDELFNASRPQLEKLPRAQLISMLEQALKASVLSTQNLGNYIQQLRDVTQERDDLKSRLDTLEAELLVLRMR